MSQDVQSEKVIVVEYADLLSDATTPDMISALSSAFGGEASLGLLAIRGVPHFVEARDALLPRAHGLAHLPADYLEENLTDPASLYNAGWSHGKERMGDSPDLAKGSFYFNPLTDLPGTEEDRARYPASYPSNLWPGEGVLPGFEGEAKRLGRIAREAVVALSRHIDAYARSMVGDGYPPNLLHDAMRRTDKAKGRLLYYFPLVESGDGEGGERDSVAEDSWIGWHNDSGFLTALVGELYMDDATGRALDPSSGSDDGPDPAAGLYVVGRSGETPVRVDIPRDCLAVQIGECTQIVTGGAVVATPHCVRGAAGRRGGTRVARISCPCFVDTAPTFPLRFPEGADRADVLNAGVGHDRVPPLGERWTHDGMKFGDFLGKTFETYYTWSKK